MAEICVAHLVWKQLGLAHFREFAASYRRNRGGIDHRLLVIFNGFGGAAETREYHELMDGIEYDALFIYPSVQDIPAYFEAAHRTECDYICFLNSYAVLLDHEWLSKMNDYGRRADVGIVGATGSWQSGYSYVLFEHGRPSAYTELLRDYYRPRLRTKRELFTLSDELRDGIRQKLFHQLYYWGLVAPFYRVVNGVRYSIKDLMEDRALLHRFSTSFEAFPAPHVRTNGFMIKRKLMLGLQRKPIVNKMDAHLFESGKDGMTGQLRRAGLRALVVGRDGRAYEPEEWHLSDTLWQGEQENLLIADNQTNDYTYGTSRRRIFLSRVAWGDQARPSLRDSPIAVGDEA